MQDGPRYHPGVCILSLGAPCVLRFYRKMTEGAPCALWASPVYLVRRKDYSRSCEGSFGVEACAVRVEVREFASLHMSCLLTHLLMVCDLLIMCLADINNCPQLAL